MISHFIYMVGGMMWWFWGIYFMLDGAGYIGVASAILGSILALWSGANIRKRLVEYLNALKKDK